MQIKIIVSGPDGIAHVIDLEQESEGFWLEFLTEMQNAGHGADTICRTIAERIKATVQPVLTAGPVDPSKLGGLAQLVREVFTLTDEGRAARREFVEGIAEAMEEHMMGARDAILAKIAAPDAQATNDNAVNEQSAEA